MGLVENLVGNGENAGRHFVPQGFQNLAISGSFRVEIVW